MILVLGGTGKLGSALVGELERRGEPVRFPTHAELDLTAPESVGRSVDQLRPTVVINAAAFTDVAACEAPGNHENVYRLNRDLPAALARACRGRGVPFLHLSTDYVFDGRNSVAYGEDDPVAPLQVYGESKLAGEQETLADYPAALVVRTSTLYGPAPRPRPHYVDAILRQARRQTSVSVVRLPVSAPTFAPDLALGLLALLAAGASGIVHWSNTGACSRLELATATVRLAGLSETVEVVERPEEPTSLRRPEFSVLDTARAVRWTGLAPRPWFEALAEYVRGSV